MIDILTDIYLFLTSTSDNVIAAQGFLLGAGALLGGLAGAQGSQTTQTTTRRLAPEGAQEIQAREISTQQLGELQGLVGAGPGGADVTQALGSQRSLARELEQLRTTGLRPGEQDISAARAQLAPQRLAIQQAFEDEQTRTSRLAAQLNRPINDPILQAKLGRSRIQAEERFGAQVSAQALQARGQRLGFGEALANLRGGLASQALQNRQTLLGLGNVVQQQQQQFRLQSAPITSSTQAGGGFGGFLTGAIGGAGAGANIASFFGGGGGQAAGGGGGFSSIFGGGPSSSQIRPQ